MPDTAAERARLALKRADLLREQAYIDGRWVGGGQGDPVVVSNPATGRPIAAVPGLGKSETAAAVDAAHVAFGAWRDRAAKERAGVLRRWYELMTEHASDLARLMTAEQGKPLKEAEGEVAYAAAFLEWFGEEAKRAYGDVIPGHQADRRIVVLKQPVGVVAAITPWNFPLAMITRKVGPALASGCTVVLRPADLTPLSALALAVLAEEAGVPPGVFNVVTGKSGPIGEVLTGDPRVRKLTFTGSTPVGKMLAERCAPTLKRVSLELGGNAPFLVFEDADLDAAADGLIASKFRNTGQTCVCANRVYVHRDVYDAFAERMAARVAKLRVGDGLEGDAEQGPLIEQKAVDKVAAHVRDAREHGAQALVGGGPAPQGGLFWSPTLLTGVRPDALMTTEETFGPVAGLIPFGDEAEGLAFANNADTGLASYVYTRDHARVWRVGETLQAGMVGVNTGLISTEVAPFGGVRDSGLGREGSHYGLDEYLDIKSLCMAV